MCKRVFNVSECSPVVPLVEFIKNPLITCKHPGCGQQVDPILWTKHVNECSFRPESELDVLDPYYESKETKHARRMKNLLASITPANNEELSKTYHTHVVMDTDTLTGLSLIYDVPASEIRRVNKLSSQSVIHERTTLLIPITATNTKQKVDEDALRRKLEHSLTLKLLREARLQDLSEAAFYLEENDYDYDAAFAQYKYDLRWERDAAIPFPVRPAATRCNTPKMEWKPTRCCGFAVLP